MMMINTMPIFKELADDNDEEKRRDIAMKNIPLIMHV